MKRIAFWSLTPLAAVALAGTVFWAGGWHEARYWPIRWLEVTGELERLTAAQVRAAVAEQAGRGFFSVDVEKARAAVEALPWVEQAQVSRHWPDALQIDVTEQRAVARWKQSALLGRRGELFEVAGTGGMQGLTRLIGPDDRVQEVFQRWQQMRLPLSQQGLELRRVELDPCGAWRLELDSGVEVLLGRQDVSNRLERFLSVRTDLRAPESIKRIDLRYPNGLAVSRRTPEMTETKSLTRSEDGRKQQPGATSNHG